MTIICLEIMQSFVDERPANVLRSLPSRQVAFVKFCNQSKHEVSIEWIDFKGHHKPYNSRLMPGEEVSVETRVGHPWMAYERHFRHPMIFSSNRSMIYFPTRSRMISRRASQAVVNILTPMLSLEKLCLQTLHKSLPNESALEKLDLPNMFKKKLMKLFFRQNPKNINSPIRLMAIT